uniref:Uncharacterized protein n=1 Tax=Rhizophora mucronata TaxID=61149 RepID=A0A2P2L8I2_RHIMU
MLDQQLRQLFLLVIVCLLQMLEIPGL